jgi:hypothetical protein
MRKGLQERFARFHASFPLDDVYLQLPRPIRNDAYLYLLALNGHQRAKEADGDVPIVIAKEIARMMGLNAERMLSSLEAILDKEGKPRIVSRTAAHVRLLKYSKWQDLPEEIAELKAKRSEAGKVGGLNSAKARATQASAEPNAVADAQASAEPLAEAPLQQRSSKPQAEREIETEGEVLVYGDAVVHDPANGRPAHPWATVSRATLIGHVGGWFLNWKQWHDIKPQTRVDLEADATAMVDIGIPGDHLHAILTELATKRDSDDVNRLSYFWQPVQDEAHARTKQQPPSHARNDDGPTRIRPAAPARSAK